MDDADASELPPSSTRPVPRGFPAGFQSVRWSFQAGVDMLIREIGRFDGTARIVRLWRSPRFSLPAVE